MLKVLRIELDTLSLIENPDLNLEGPPGLPVPPLVKLSTVKLLVKLPPAVVMIILDTNWEVLNLELILEDILWDMEYSPVRVPEIL